METMISINIDSKTKLEKEEDLIKLMEFIQISKSYSIRELSRHMWTTIGQYYIFLEDIKKKTTTKI